MSTSAPAATENPQITGARAAPAPGEPGVLTHLIAFAGYLALALVATYPLVLHFTTQVPGDLLADRDQHLWNLWWIGQAATRLTNPFHTAMLFYPYGVGLYYHALGLPLGLIGLLPLWLLGLPASYNTVVLAAFTLAGYAAFRLCLYVTSPRDKVAPEPAIVGVRVGACFLGGVVFAFTPYMLYALEGTTEVFSIQWIPFYAEFWLRAWHSGRKVYAVAAGVFLALAAYTSLYFAVYLLLFTVIHVLYSVFSGGARKPQEDGIRPARDKLWALKTVTGAVVLVVAGILSLPLARGLLVDYNNPRFEVSAGQGQQLEHSADLLGLFSIPYDHPLLGNGGSGGPAEKNNLPSHSYLTLGYVALALAVVGAITARKRKETPFWVISGVVFLLLAMGPQLQIGLTATGIPLPFKLLESLPGIDAVGKVERFTVMTRLSMGVLAAWGAITVLTWLGSIVRGPQYARVALPLSAVLALLLVELPIYPRYMQPLGIPGGFETLASLKDGGGLMELPVTAHQDEVVGERMLFQTEHDHPIMGGYLSRAYTSPIMDSCGPFWSFISASYLPIEGTDIVSPTMESRPQDVLNFYNLKYIANYAGYGGPGSEKTFPVDPKDRAAYQDILDHVSHAPPLYKDSYVEIRKVDPVSTDSMVPSLLTANGWYNLEGGSVPFRWVKDGTATMCVFSPQAIKADLLMEGTAFGQQRDMQISVTGTPGNTTPSQSYKTSLPPGGSFAPVKAPFTFGAGMTEVVLTSPGPGTTPQSLDPANKDARPLTVGLRNVRLENVQPAP